MDFCCKACGRIIGIDEEVIQIRAGELVIIQGEMDFLDDETIGFLHRSCFNMIIGPETVKDLERLGAEAKTVEVKK